MTDSQFPSEEREQKSGSLGDQTSPEVITPVASGSLPNTLADPWTIVASADPANYRRTATHIPSEKKRFQIAFGAFAPKIREQIIAAGFELKAPITKSSLALTHLQLDADAVARLRIRNRITEAQASKAEMKIVKEIGQLLVIP